MGRWLLLSSSLLVLGALASVDPARAPNANPLGGTCEVTRDCRVGTRCVETEGAMEGQCSTACSTTTACQQQFGGASLCLGADLCARTCTHTSDCPSETLCNAYGWCERSVE